MSELDARKSRPRIGLLPTGHFYYWDQFPNLREMGMRMYRKLLDLLQERAEVVAPDLVDDVEKSKKAARLFKEQGVDMVLIFPFGYTPSMQIVPVAYELDVEDPDHATAEPLLARADSIRAWAERVFVVRAGEAACAAEAGALSAVDVEGALRMTRAVRLEIAFACDGTPTTFRDEAVFDSDAQHEAIVRVGERPTIHHRASGWPSSTRGQIVSANQHAPSTFGA